MARKGETTDSLRELKLALKNKSLDRLYFFHGEETFLLQHYLDQLRKLLVDDLTESFNYHKLTGETCDIRSVQDENPDDCVYRFGCRDSRSSSARDLLQWQSR